MYVLYIPYLLFPSQLFVSFRFVSLRIFISSFQCAWKTWQINHSIAYDTEIRVRVRNSHFVRRKLIPSNRVFLKEESFCNFSKNISSVFTKNRRKDRLRQRQRHWKIFASFMYLYKICIILFRISKHLKYYYMKTFN